MFYKKMKTVQIGFLFILVIIDITGAQTPCSNQNRVGDDPSLTSVPQISHGQSRTVVLYDSSINTIQCCGVVVSWELKVNSESDGCPSTLSPPCLMDFMVFDSVDSTTRQAKLVGVNQNNSVVAPGTTTGNITISIPVSQQIRVKQGDVIGFSGLRNGVEFVDDTTATMTTCNANGYTCHKNYMMTSSGTVINSQNPGQTYTFQELGSDSSTINRYYGFRANIQKGIPPSYGNLPATKTISSSTPVGTVVYQVAAIGNYSVNKLTMTLVRQCPIGTYFTLNNVTGEVTLAKAVNKAPYLNHTLTIDVNDQCQTTTGTLIINVQEDTTTTAATTSSNTQSPAGSSGSSGDSGLLSTTDGKILVALLAATVAFLIAAIVGLCCLCWMIRNVMKSQKPKPNSSPYYDNDPYSQYDESQQMYQESSPGKQNDPAHDYNNGPRSASRPKYTTHR